MLTRVDFIADQLRQTWPQTQWVVAGIDRAIELARILDRAGVINLSALRIKPQRGTVRVFEPVWQEIGGDFMQGGEWQSIDVDGYAFDYYGKTIGYLGTPNEPAADQIFLPDKTKGLLLAWSAEGSGNVGYVVQPDAQGLPMIVPKWGSSSEAREIISNVKSLASFVAFVALPLAGISIGANVGAAILGSSLTAAAPWLAPVVGNIAVSTALSGGDVKNAVTGALKSAATGGVSSTVGSTITQLTNSSFLGVVTQAATNAAIRGDNVATSVGFALASEGAKMDFSPLLDVETAAPLNYDFGLVDWSDPGTFTSFDPLETFQFDFIGPASDIYQFSPIASGFGADPLGFTFDPLSADGYFSFDFNSLTGTQGFQVEPLPIYDAPSLPPANSSTWNPTTIINTMSQAAMSAIAVTRAFQSLKNPAVQTTARVTGQNGQTIVGTSAGVIQVRDASGAISTVRPAVGVPQATIDGGWIVNNGDGTYMLVSSSGAVSRHAYSSQTAQSPTLVQSSQAGLSTPMLIGLAVLGVGLLMSK